MLKIIKSLLEKHFKKPTDPVKMLPKNVIEKVFSYLNKDDLLTSSLVNKSWLKFIGKSENCMKKLKFVICEPLHGMLWKFTAADAANILTNERKYKHIALFITRSMTKDHLLIVASFEWKTVNLCHHTFRSEIELLNFFGLIEPFVEELELTHIKTAFTKRKQIGSVNFIFPKLKKLKVSFCCTFIFSEMLKNVLMLHFLEIETEPLACDDSEDIIQRIKGIEVILLNNVKIKSLVLHLHQSDFDGMFMNQRFLQRIRFQLESLTVKKFKRLEGMHTNIVQTANFGEFLKSQNKTLTKLSVLDCLGVYVLEIIINELEKLKSIELGDLKGYEKLEDSVANISFFKNESVENLTLKSSYSEYCDLQNVLLTTVPNLKTLYIGTVNQKMLETLIDKVPKLLKLELDFFTAYSPPERAVLCDLKEMTIKIDYASNFKDQLRGFTNYTRFEMEFLKAVRVLHENSENLR